MAHFFASIVKILRAVTAGKSYRDRKFDKAKTPPRTDGDEKSGLPDLTIYIIGETIIHILDFGGLKMVEKKRWQKFPGVPNRDKRESVRVTLNNRKVLRLNQEAYTAIGDPAAVELFFDEDTLTIGVAPVDPRIRNSFPVNRQKHHGKRSAGVHIYGSPFCKHFDIKPRGTMLFTDVQLDNEGTMHLELTTAITIGRGYR